MTKIQEIWKDIPDYEGKYQASNLGRIKSIKRIGYNPRYGNQNIPDRIMKQTDRIGKYLIVTLHNNGIQSVHSVHRLVAIAFIPNPEKKATVNHKNGIRTDNRVVNLEWLTHLENVQHAVKNGIGPHSRKHKKQLL